MGKERRSLSGEFQVKWVLPLLSGDKSMVQLLEWMMKGEAGKADSDGPALQQVRANYDRLSGWWDLFSLPERRYVHAGLRMLGAKPGERVLEIGFGTGNALLSLAQSVGPGGRAYGLDISPRMYAVAWSKLERRHLQSEVTLHLCSASTLPFPDSALDAVFSSFTLELFSDSDLLTVLRECARVLRNGGRICAVAMSARNRNRLAPRLYRWAHGRYPNIVDCRPILVARALGQTGLTVERAEEMVSYGLPVDVVLATKGLSKNYLLFWDAGSCPR